jgi:predicted GIY-YIG superfamily endonuclease
VLTDESAMTRDAHTPRVTSKGPLWRRMDRQPRRALKTLTRPDVPVEPGVYALYRHGRSMYVGKANSLKSRFWGQHMSRNADMTKSALRRNVAAHLGIATAADIKARCYQPSEGELDRVASWIRDCDVAWLECETAKTAVDLERDMKNESMPPLTQR